MNPKHEANSYGRSLAKESKERMNVLRSRTLTLFPADSGLPVFAVRFVTCRSFILNRKLSVLKPASAETLVRAESK